MTTFIDTSALLAILDEDDPEHSAADETLRFLFQGEPLTTHAYAVLESAAVVQRKLGAEAVRDLFNRLLPAIDIVFVDEELHHTAVTSLIAAGGRRVSLVDWTSFVFMRERGIEDAFSFDRDFAAQGFNLVPSPVSTPDDAIST